MNALRFFLLALIIAIPTAQARPPKAAKIFVFKSQRVMMLVDEQGKLLKSYRVALGKSPIGRKRQRGDNKTPEGIYYIEDRNVESNYHLSLKISYPNNSDWQNAERFGVRPGDMIMIHGLPNGRSWMGKEHIKKDWTEGCIAVTNEEIQEIWQLVDDGTPIEIKP